MIRDAMHIASVPVAVLACLLATAPLPPCMVLCVGDDGHFAIEHAHDEHASPCHDHGATGHSSAEAVTAPETDHGGHSCLDFPLSAAISVGFPPPLHGALKFHPVNEALEVCASTAVADSHGPSAPGARAVHAADFALPSLRTVILRI